MFPKIQLTSSGSDSYLETNRRQSIMGTNGGLVFFIFLFTDAYVSLWAKVRGTSYGAKVEKDMYISNVVYILNHYQNWFIGTT